MKYKWRVVIIMAHDGETYFEYNDLEQSILDQKGFDNLSYYILYYNQKYDKISIKDVRIEDEKRYLRERPETKNFTGENIFFKKETLTNFLNMVKSFEDSNDPETEYHYFVITWGHGGGLFLFPSNEIEKLLVELGISQDENKELVEAINSEFLENLQVFAQMSGDISFKNYKDFASNPFPFLPVNMFTSTMEFAGKVDNTDIDKSVKRFNRHICERLLFYTAADLNTAFVNSLKRVDVYFALNCFTQMIETGYELKESVDLMVAPQTTMPLTGINYREIFKTLEDKPEISLEELSKVFTSSYDRKYTEDFIKTLHTHYPEFDIKRVSFSCNRLAAYDDFLECLNQLTRLIKRIYETPELTEVIRKVSRARRLCGDLTPDNNYGIIDLNDFLIQLQKLLPVEFFNEISSIKGAFENVKVNQVLMAIKEPGTVAVTAPGKPADNPLCLSFFAPAVGKSDMKEFLLKIYADSKSKYAKESDWVRFVRDFYDRTLIILP